MNNLFKILNKRGISINKFAKDLEMPYAQAYRTVHRENLCDCKLRTVLEISKYLNVKIEELI